MALEMPFEKYGLTASKCYVVVTEVHYSKGLHQPTPAIADTNSIMTVLFYSDKNTRDADKEPMESRSISFKMNTASDAKDSVTQAYAHLKTLDEFKDATDV